MKREYKKPINWEVRRFCTGQEYVFWLEDQIADLVKYWKEPDTPLPHPDIFDECVKTLEFAGKEI